ncbi:MAG: type II toxin-antitoxin system prevent-host-death family antitoxin [bacterium]|nr:type II toxin-antitoxin system prevent-host-death family antitoxin [bacterium]
MDISTPNIIPVTQARAMLGDLVKSVSGENYVILTKGGSPKAAIVDFKYLIKIQKEIGEIYKKTFIDPTLSPYLREFSDKEIEEWQKEDSLV